MHYVLCCTAAMQNSMKEKHQPVRIAFQMIVARLPHLLRRQSTIRFCLLKRGIHSSRTLMTLCLEQLAQIAAAPAATTDYSTGLPSRGSASRSSIARTAASCGAVLDR